MDDRQKVYAEIEHWIAAQERKGKAFDHKDATWATIMMDYLGRAVRLCFQSPHVASYTFVAKALAVGVSWLEQRFGDGWVGDAEDTK